MTLNNLLSKHSYENILSVINSATDHKIESILNKETLDFTDFITLLSEKSYKYLPQIVDLSKKLTIKRFGKTINFYIPVYLSNTCSNECVYCGFNTKKDIKRNTLNIKEIEEEYKKVSQIGYDNVLLLTGEDRISTNIDYIKEAVKLSKKYFTYTALEIYPLLTEEYRELVNAGADGLTIYQETYHNETYSSMHLKGKKKDYNWRLLTPERACQAGFRKVGLGALLGLFDWRYEISMLALHIDYLQKNYWKTEFTVGFPRINPPDTDFKIPSPVNDKNYILLISALRLFLQETGFVLTTRERPELRNNLIGLSITQISAGSKTNPGGYLSSTGSNEQFSVSDSRTLSEMIQFVKSKGYEAVIKDWENNFSGIQN